MGQCLMSIGYDVPRVFPQRLKASTQNKCLNLKDIWYDGRTMAGSGSWRQSPSGHGVWHHWNSCVYNTEFRDGLQCPFLG